MEHKEWIALLDKYLLTGTMLSEEYEVLYDEQKFTIQELKKAFARINKKETNELHHSLNNK